MNTILGLIANPEKCEILLYFLLVLDHLLVARRPAFDWKTTPRTRSPSTMASAPHMWSSRSTPRDFSSNVGLVAVSPEITIVRAAELIR